VNYEVAKRCFDVTAAGIALVLLGPGLAVLASILRVSIGRGVIFRQRRIGLKGRIFWIAKFRTMTNVCDSSGNLLPDDMRLTALGRRIRRLSLDELPQLWNVLKGEMSLVGPRPLLPEYLARYSTLQSRRHEVKPGITGWAQIKGRNSITWEQKFELDVWYVLNASFWLDMKILVWTLVAVLRREGINHEGHATTSIFMGSTGVRKPS
jgi:sugar transferase EpsL